MRKASGHSKPQTVIEAAQAEFASVIVENSEASKAALAVTLTCLTYKILTPQQDIRNHQQSIPGGFSGRTFDSHVITPFLRRQSFPCMAESGWLTRSFEHKEPYSMAYKGAIKPQKLKTAFLSLIDSVQTKNSKRENESLLSYVLELLIIARDSKSIRPAIPRNCPLPPQPPCSTAIFMPSIRLLAQQDFLSLPFTRFTNACSTKDLNAFKAKFYFRLKATTRLTQKAAELAT